MKNRWTLLVAVAVVAVTSSGCRRACTRFCQSATTTEIDTIVPEPGDTVMVEPGDTVIVEPGDTVTFEPGDSTASRRRFGFDSTGVLLLPRRPTR